MTADPDAFPHALHVIRLRAPWHIELPGESPTLVRCTRHFNKPTGLDGGEHVWLVIEGLVWSAEVSLNDAHVGQAPRMSPGNPPVRFDITPLLQPRNRMVIDLDCPAGDRPATCPGDVRLEIG